MTDYSSMSLEDLQALMERRQKEFEEVEKAFADRTKDKEAITLKWGTLKAWDVRSEASQKLVDEFFKDGVCMSAMMDRPGPERRQVLCRLIEQLDGTVFNDWEDKFMTKQEAIKYVTEYGS